MSRTTLSCDKSAPLDSLREQRRLERNGTPKGGSMTRWYGLLALGFLALWIPQSGVRGNAGAASIVWPQPGKPLYFRGTIEVELDRLALSDFGLLEARVEAKDWPWGNPLQEPLTLWEGSAWVRVLPGGTPSDEGCAWVTWTDQTSGRALLRLLWNHFEPGFRSGDYDVRVHIRVRSTDRGVQTWGQTDWYRIQLIPAEATTLPVSLTRPSSRSEFGLGETVVVAGVTGIPTVPIRARLEVRLQGAERWEAVAQQTFSTNSFEFRWDANVSLGTHQVRVCVVDARGAAGKSDPIEIRIVRRILRVQLSQPPQRAEVRVGEPLLVQGELPGAVPPVTLTIERSLHLEQLKWDLVKEVTLPGTSFEYRWDTSRLAPGVFFLRVRARDAQGLSAASGEVEVVLRESSLRILVNGRLGETFEVRELAPVQFELDAEGTWTRFVWNFDDGATSEQRAPTHSFSKPGSHNVCVEAYAADSPPRKVCVTLVVTARNPVAATRRIFGYPCPCSASGFMCEGVAAVVYHPPGKPAAAALVYPVRVEVVIMVLEPVTGFIFTERVHQGWTLKPISESDESVRVERLQPLRATGKPYSQWSWLVTSAGPQFELRPGAQIVIAYLLFPPIDTRPLAVGIEGDVFCQLGPDVTSERKVAGSSRVTAVANLDPATALVYLRREPDGSYGLNPPEAVQDSVLTIEQLRIAEELMREGKPVPFAGGAVLSPTDYLKLLACFQTGRPVLDCLGCQNR